MLFQEGRRNGLAKISWVLRPVLHGKNASIAAGTF
jgi:hypothetical protein